MFCVMLLFSVSCWCGLCFVVFCIVLCFASCFVVYWVFFCVFSVVFWGLLCIVFVYCFFVCFLFCCVWCRVFCCYPWLFVFFVAATDPSKLNPISQGVSSLSLARGGVIWYPHVALHKSNIFRNWAHMQKIGQKSHQLSMISRFQNFDRLRFRLTLTHRNCHNSLKFWAHLLDLV